MAFSVAQSRMGVHTYPLPWAPQLRDAYTRVLRRGIVIFTALWLPIGTGVAWVFVGNLRSENYTRWTDLPWWLPLVMALAPVVLATMSTRQVINTALIKALGYGRASTPRVSGRFATPPSTVATLSYGVTGASFALGWSIGAGIALGTAHSTSPPHAVLAVTVALGVAALIGWTSVRALHRARLGWREEKRRQSVAARVLAHGTRTLGEVTAVRFTKEWLNQQPVFALTIRYPGADDDRAVEIFYPDYPRWGPTVGNQFDVWFDPADPDNPERVLLQRRMIGQDFDPEPQSLRRPSSGGDGPGIGPIAPKWAQQPDKSPFRMRLRLYRGVATSALLSALLVLATILWLAEFGLGNWWELPLLLTMTGLYTLNALWWSALATRARWVAHAAWTTETLGWIGFCLMYPVLGMIIARLVADLNRFELNGVALVLSGLVALAGINGVVVGSIELRFAHLLTADRPAPVEEVAEALRSSDPQALPRLEHRYGYRVGVQHTL